MERIKVAALVVIAVALGRLAFGPAVQDAHAAEGGVTCETFFIADTTAMKLEKIMEIGRTHASAVKVWLEAHPGEPVFRTTFANQFGQMPPAGYVDVLCVR